jgi:hypothetical protein
MGHVAPRRPRARAAYRAVVAAGIAQGRRRAVCRARAGIAHLALAVGGDFGARLAPFLGVRLPAIHTAAQRGRDARNRWEQVLQTIKR